MSGIAVGSITASTTLLLAGLSIIALNFDQVPVAMASIVAGAFSAEGVAGGAIGVLIDVGRVWWTWKLPLFFWTWNLSSIQLEVALCIMLYTFVLWIELSPAFLEQWAKGPDSFFKRFAAAATPKIMRAMPWLIALGMLLPTMHQSSLGNMILLAGPKLHPLWYTTWIPFLFLVSCIGMGYGVTIMETMISRTVYKRPGETKVLMEDRETGLLTALFRCRPGAELPLHEHVDIEQTYVLEGSLADDEGEVTAGNYVWRPAGSRHVAGTPNGALLLSFFLRPNRSACSTTIKVALGTSIPTSITVVATSTSNCPSRNALIVASFSLAARLVRLPWRLVMGSAGPMAAPPLSSAIMSNRGLGPNSALVPVTSTALVFG